MESSLTFLERVVGVLIFCMAINILLIETVTLHKTITSLKRAANNQQVLYEQPLEVIDEEEVTYASIMGILMGEVTCDIAIDYIEIKREYYNPQTFDFSKIHKTSYRKSYELNPQGEIVKVIFIK